MSKAADVRIVLVRPRDPRNVGAACRAMKCMGLEELVIVAEGLLDPAQARVLAHYAADVLDRARVCADLREAIGDAVLVAGTTRRRGKNRKYFSVFPEQLAERIGSIGAGTVAVLFGNEENGLTDEELALCNLAVTIPASPRFPSLNLSHAVQVVCYEIFRGRTRSRLTPFLPIGARAAEDLVGTITGSLKSIGFFTQVTPDQMAVFFRDIIARAALSGDEARRLGVIFRKIAGLASRHRTDGPEAASSD
ncbi:MAG TPA: TrmJ/YjtD family RNA methyltransferase [Spirochaetia bacterium]|nr:TrmJ/YjtD family RNA methyltransferase [Spirochaetia bacterium]